MKKLIFLTIIFIISTSLVYSQKPDGEDRWIARGQESGELYFTPYDWYDYDFYPYAKTAIFRIIENGKKLTVQCSEINTYSYQNPYDSIMWPSGLFTDAKPGVLYNRQNYYKDYSGFISLWVSFDYGINWNLIEVVNDDLRTFYYSSVFEGLIYRSSSSQNTDIRGWYQSADYGKTFTKIQDVNSWSMGEPGWQECEFFIRVNNRIGHTTNCNLTYTEITIGEEHNSALGWGEIYRGGNIGELYLCSWSINDDKKGYDYKIYFSDNYWNDLRLVYICEDCHHNYEATCFMSDIEPGKFFIVRTKHIWSEVPDGYHVQLTIYHYENYGETLVATYVQNVTHDYGTYCQPVVCLAAKQQVVGDVLVSWQDESSLPVDSFLVFRKKIGSGGTGLWELASRNFGNELFYLDENLPDGLYEYYVVTYYVTGCIAKYSDIVQVYVGFCEAVNDLSSDVLDDKNVILNWSLPDSEVEVEVEGYSVYRNNELLNSELLNGNFYLDENLPVGVYEYYVVAHYTNGCVSANSNIETVNIDYVGIVETDNYPSLRIYPNPTTGKFTITFLPRWR